MKPLSNSRNANMLIYQKKGRKSKEEYMPRVKLTEDLICTIIKLSTQAGTYVAN